MQKELKTIVSLVYDIAHAQCLYIMLTYSTMHKNIISNQKEKQKQTSGKRVYKI